MEGHEEAVIFYESTIEGLEEAEGIGNEYMTMDAEQWADNDDVYENADTLGIEHGQIADSRAQTQGVGLAGRRKRVNKARNTDNKVNLAVPLPSRYMTIRLPPPNANKAAGKKDQLVFFRLTTVSLVVMCFLLIGALVVLSLVYVKLAHINVSMSSKITNITNLQETWTPSTISETFYIASPDGLTKDNLNIFCPHKLKKYMETGMFHLYSSSAVNESYYNQSTWLCTCYTT